MGLGAGLGARRHHVAGNAGQSGFLRFEKRGVIQRPRDRGHAVVFDHDDLEAIVELEFGGRADFQFRSRARFGGLAAVDLTPGQRAHSEGQSEKARAAKEGGGNQFHGWELGSCKK